MPSTLIRLFAREGLVLKAGPSGKKRWMKAAVEVTKPVAAKPQQSGQKTSATPHVSKALALAHRLGGEEGRWHDQVALHVNSLTKLPQQQLTSIARGLGHSGEIDSKDSALMAISDALIRRIQAVRNNPKRLLSERVRKHCEGKDCGKPGCSRCEKMADPAPNPAADIAVAPKLARVEGVELFEVGNHRGKDYTVADLDKIVANFNLLSGAGVETKLLTPTVVIGHQEEGEEGNILENTGYPAAGVVERIWRSGTKLYGDLADIVPEVARLIQQRSYRKVSAEIYDDFEHDGVHYGMALRRVALLGAEIPQVKTLSDIPLATFADKPGQKIHRTFSEFRMQPRVFQGADGRWYWNRPVAKHSEGVQKFAWQSFQTRKGTVGARNEKGQRVYGSKAQQVLAAAQKQAKAAGANKAAAQKQETAAAGRGNEAGAVRAQAKQAQAQAQAVGAVAKAQAAAAVQRGVGAQPDAAKLRAGIERARNRGIISDAEADDRLSQLGVKRTRGDTLRAQWGASNLRHVGGQALSQLRIVADAGTEVAVAKRQIKRAGGNDLAGRVQLGNVQGKLAGRTRALNDTIADLAARLERHRAQSRAATGLKPTGAEPSPRRMALGLLAALGRRKETPAVIPPMPPIPPKPGLLKRAAGFVGKVLKKEAQNVIRPSVALGAGVGASFGPAGAAIGGLIGYGAGRVVDAIDRRIEKRVAAFERHPNMPAAEAAIPWGRGPIGGLWHATKKLLRRAGLRKASEGAFTSLSDGCRNTFRRYSQCKLRKACESNPNYGGQPTPGVCPGEGGGPAAAAAPPQQQPNHDTLVLQKAGQVAKAVGKGLGYALTRIPKALALAGTGVIQGLKMGGKLLGLDYWAGGKREAKEMGLPGPSVLGIANAIPRGLLGIKSDPETLKPSWHPTDSIPARFVKAPFQIARGLYRGAKYLLGRGSMASVGLHPLRGAVEPLSEGARKFSWQPFKTRRGTTGARNEKGQRVYGKEAQDVLRTKPQTSARPPASAALQNPDEPPAAQAPPSQPGRLRRIAQAAGRAAAAAGKKVGGAVAAVPGAKWVGRKIAEKAPSMPVVGEVIRAKQKAAREGASLGVLGGLKQAAIGATKVIPVAAGAQRAVRGIDLMRKRQGLPPASLARKVGAGVVGGVKDASKLLWDLTTRGAVNYSGAIRAAVAKRHGRRAGLAAAALYGVPAEAMDLATLGATKFFPFSLAKTPLAIGAKIAAPLAVRGYDAAKAAAGEVGARLAKRFPTLAGYAKAGADAASPLISDARRKVIRNVVLPARRLYRKVRETVTSVYPAVRTPVAAALNTAWQGVKQVGRDLGQVGVGLGMAARGAVGRAKQDDLAGTRFALGAGLGHAGKHLGYALRDTGIGAYKVGRAVYRGVKAGLAKVGKTLVNVRRDKKTGKLAWGGLVPAVVREGAGYLKRGTLYAGKKIAQAASYAPAVARAVGRAAAATGRAIGATARGIKYGLVDAPSNAIDAVGRGVKALEKTRGGRIVTGAIEALNTGTGYVSRAATWLAGKALRYGPGMVFNVHRNRAGERKLGGALGYGLRAVGLLGHAINSLGPAGATPVRRRSSSWKHSERRPPRSRSLPRTA